MLVTIDASSIIYAWDNYPIEQFPKVWEWLCEEVNNKSLAISKVAFEEVKRKMPECATWMDNCRIEKLDITNEILKFALSIHKLLGIEGDDYHPDGVGENDIIIIATAKLLGAVLISDEKKQPGLPKNKKRYKIPAVCRLSEIDIECISFLEYLKTSKRVF